MISAKFCCSCPCCCVVLRFFFRSVFVECCSPSSFLLGVRLAELVDEAPHHWCVFLARWVDLARFVCNEPKDGVASRCCFVLLSLSCPPVLSCCFSCCSFKCVRVDVGYVVAELPWSRMLVGQTSDGAAEFESEHLSNASSLYPHFSFALRFYRSLVIASWLPRLALRSGLTRRR